eukprot:gene34751-40818_t
MRMKPVTNQAGTGYCARDADNRTITGRGSAPTRGDDMKTLIQASLRAALATTILSAGALTLATPAIAQTTSTVQGHIDGAAAGATVTLTDTGTGHVETTKVDAKGNYILVGLPPSTYRVTSGGRSAEVVVPLGQAVTADLVAPTAATPSA